MIAHWAELDELQKNTDKSPQHSIQSPANESQDSASSKSNVTLSQEAIVILPDTNSSTYEFLKGFNQYKNEMEILENNIGLVERILLHLNNYSNSTVIKGRPGKSLQHSILSSVDESRGSIILRSNVIMSESHRRMLPETNNSDGLRCVSEMTILERNIVLVEKIIQQLNNSSYKRRKKKKIDRLHQLTQSIDPIDLLSGKEKDRIIWPHQNFATNFCKEKTLTHESTMSCDENFEKNKTDFDINQSRNKTNDDIIEKHDCVGKPFPVTSQQSLHFNENTLVTETKNDIRANCIYINKLLLMKKVNAAEIVSNPKIDYDSLLDVKVNSTVDTILVDALTEVLVDDVLDFAVQSDQNSSTLERDGSGQDSNSQLQEIVLKKHRSNLGISIMECTENGIKRMIISRYSLRCTIICF